MPNYKELYLTMFRASEQAVNLLLAAQRECEEHYISAPQPELTVFPLPTESKQVMLNLEQYAALTDEVEAMPDDADKAADSTRYTEDKRFSRRNLPDEN